MYDKEAVYDEKISPLMKEIIEICKAEEMPMVAQFYLKEKKEDTGKPMYCSTVLVPAKDKMNHEAYEQLRKLVT